MTLLDNLESLAETPSWNWPELAGSWVKAGLRSGASPELLSALQLAAELVVMDDEIAQMLVDILISDRSSELRVAAVLALSPGLEEASDVGFDVALDPEFDTTALTRKAFLETRAAVRSVYSDASQPALVRQACLRVAVRAPEDWQDAEVKKAYQSPDREWRLTALECMGWLQGFDRQLVAALAVPGDAELASVAVRAAALAGVELAGPLVLEIARSESTEPELRETAVAALGQLCPPGSDDLLLELTQGGDENLAAVASEALEEREVFSEPPQGR